MLRDAKAASVVAWDAVGLAGGEVARTQLVAQSKHLVAYCAVYAIGTYYYGALDHLAVLGDDLDAAVGRLELGDLHAEGDPVFVL